MILPRKTEEDLFDQNFLTKSQLNPDELRASLDNSVHFNEKDTQDRKTGNWSNLILQKIISETVMVEETKEEII